MANAALNPEWLLNARLRYLVCTKYFVCVCTPKYQNSHTVGVVYLFSQQDI